MLVNLYTVRIVLENLGAEDYGIYSVVAGVVVLFTFLNTAMTNATQRFINIALGQNDSERARDVYSISFVIHILIAILTIILAETVGLWFFYNVLNIPPYRQNIAFIVYQFSIALIAKNIIMVPYQATIIAYEKMSFFALISFVEAFFKIAIAFLLSVLLFDKLLVYAILVFLVGLIIFLIYKVYCNWKFEIARFRFCRDRELFRQLAGFSGWSVVSRISFVSRNKGIIILINIFHGVAMNAALGIALQVNSTVYSFVNNFQTAFQPQIVKLYAAKEHDNFIRLIFLTSKSSFYLLLLFVLPFYINADFVLQLWLKNVPEYTVIFTRWTLLYLLTEAITRPLRIAMHATGNIKNYELITSCFIFMILPLSFFFLWSGFSPVWILIIKFIVNFLLLIWNIFFLDKMINLSVVNFFIKVILPISIITVISGIIVIIFYYIQFDYLTKLMVSCIVSILSVFCMIYCIGLDAQEKLLLKNWIIIKYKKVHNAIEEK